MAESFVYLYEGIKSGDLEATMTFESSFNGVVRAKARLQRNTEVGSGKK